MTDASPTGTDAGTGAARARDRPQVDPALGLDLAPHRALRARQATVTICIPAHNEASTVGEVVRAGHDALDLLGVAGEVVVCASGCTDDTAAVATGAGARVVASSIGKGVAIRTGIAAAAGDIIVTVDGDFRYYGPEPIAATLARPILAGTSDATIADLYWRPIYPQLWFQGFFAPIAGRLFPEILGKVGTTPWSGQRAALRPMWDVELPDDFTVEMILNLAWNDMSARVRPVLADDWTNPQRPKPDLPYAELEIVLDHAQRAGRLDRGGADQLRYWFALVHDQMATYQPEADDPARFEADLLRFSLAHLPNSFHVGRDTTGS